MYLYTVFDGKDGLYYDSVGDEVFVAKRLSIEFSPILNCKVPVYELDFGDGKVTGLVKDHGYNTFLGEV